MKPQTITTSTEVGDVELQVQHSGGIVQVNCMMPPRGPGFFVVFPAGEEGKAMDAAMEVAGREGLPENANITDTVPGCLAAGTMPRPSVQIGTPGVHHAE